MKNFNNNYVLTNEQVQELIKKKIINPFVPQTPNGLTPIYVLKKEDLKIIGEGGLGSGKELPDEFGDPPKKGEKITNALRQERRRQQLKNAQKKYRETKRADYNKKQNEYYKEMKKDPERYANWIEKMKEANERYKAKKGYVRDLNKKKKEAEREAKKIWKKENKGKRGRPKKGETKVKKDIDEAWVKMKADEIYSEKIKDLQKQGEVVQKELKPNKEGKLTFQFPKEYNEANAVLEYPYTGDEELGYTAEVYLAYNKEKQVPKEIKKAYRKKKGLPEEEPVKEKKVKEKKEPVKKEVNKEEQEIKMMENFSKDTNYQANFKSPSIRKIVTSGKTFNEWYEKKFGKPYQA